MKKILHTRLSNFFKKLMVLYDNQYGFQSNISTTLPMLDVVTSSYNNYDCHCYTGLAFFDLRKALDTVAHETLLEKLSNYGIRNAAYNLI